MTPEQLKEARAERWRQKADPVLTLEDAEGWLNQTGLCLFLPRRTQLPAPAPSFTEAFLGRESATPRPAEIAEAATLLDRVFETGTAVPLNLLGGLAEQPDFIANTDALPSIFALRGDRNWKNGPKGKASPLVAEVWKVLDREGALTVTEIQDRLGRELTEAALHRALNELWGGLRIVPAFSGGKSGRIVHWELMQSRFQKAMHAGGGMSLAAALSALVSLYLQSAVAATGAEVETFLSPLASRSKIREAVRGLSATRQLGMVSCGTEVVFHITDELPEFPEIEAEAEQPRTEYVPRHEGGKRPPYKRPATVEDTERKPRVREDAPRREWTKRPAAASQGASQGEGWKPRRAGGEFAPKTEGGQRPPFRKPAGKTGFGAQGGEHRPFKPRSEGQPRAEGEGFVPRREGGSRPPFKKSYGAGRGERRPFVPRAEGAGKPRAEGTGPSERRPGRSFGGETGERRPYRPRPEGDGFAPRRDGADRRPPYRKSGGDSRPGKSFGPAGGERRPFKPRSERDKPFERRPGRSFGGETGERRSYKPRGEEQGPGSRPPYRKGGGDSRPGRSFGAAGGERRPFKPRSEGGRPIERKPGRSFGGETGERRPYKPRGEEQGPGSRPPFRKGPGSSGPRRESGAGSGAGRPFKRAFKPRTEGFAPRGEGGAARPPQRGKPGGFGRKPGFKSAGSKPGFKAGGSRPAFKSGSRPGYKSGGAGRSGGFSRKPGSGGLKRPGGSPARRPGGFQRKPREESGE